MDSIKKDRHSLIKRWKKLDDIFSVVSKVQNLCCIFDLKFGDGDEPNLGRAKKADASSAFIENIFRSGLTLVSSNDIITIKIEKKIIKNHKQKRLFKKIFGLSNGHKGNELRL